MRKPGGSQERKAIAALLPLRSHSRRRLRAELPNQRASIAGMTKSLRPILCLFAVTGNDHKCWERAKSVEITESDLQATRQKWHAPFERLVRRPQAGAKVRPLRIPMPVPQIFTRISQDLTAQDTCFLNMFCHKSVTLTKISKTCFYS